MQYSKVILLREGVQDQLTIIQVWIHISAYDEIAPGSFRTQVHYVLDEILDVTYFFRDTADDSVEQPYFLAVLLTYVGDVNYGRNRLRREIQNRMWDARVMSIASKLFSRPIKTEKRGKPYAIVANQ